jgi:hypothetical protein
MEYSQGRLRLNVRPDTGQMDMYIYPCGLRSSQDLQPSRRAQMNIHLPQDINRNSPQIKLLLEWHEALKEKSVDSLGRCLHKDFRRVVYPQHIGEPTQNKESFLKQCEAVYFAVEVEVSSTPRYSTSSPLTAFPLQWTIHSIIEAPGRLVLHVCIPPP